MNSPYNSAVPAVSIVLCTCNGARYLPEQLESIARQSRQPAEMIVCDDGSEDDTVAILRAFATEVRFPVRIVKNPCRLGSTRNFDKAIGLASGEFTALCDQDDVWSPEKLERLSDILISDCSLGCVFSDADLINEESKPIGMTLFTRHRFSARKQRELLNNPAALLLKHDVVTGATLMFRATMRPHFQPIPQSWMHDSWLTWMIALHSRIALTADPLTAYRIHADQQLGIGRARSKQSHSGGETRRQHYARVAQQFEDLTSHLLRSGLSERDELILQLHEKIAFLRKQSMLSTSLVVRVRQILSLFPCYLQYARGLGSLRTDLLLGRETS
jgi:glycosyltransferase involved in cell wall biosynthesis